MTPERFKACLDVLRWTPVTLASVLDMDDRQTRRWGSTAPIPAAVAAWLDSIATFHEQNPPPAKPKTPATAGPSARQHQGASDEPPRPDPAEPDA